MNTKKTMALFERENALNKTGHEVEKKDSFISCFRAHILKSEARH